MLDLLEQRDNTISKMAAKSTHFACGEAPHKLQIRRQNECLLCRKPKDAVGHSLCQSCFLLGKHRKGKKTPKQWGEMSILIKDSVEVKKAILVIRDDILMPKPLRCEASLILYDASL